MFSTAGIKECEKFRPYRDWIRGPLSRDDVQEATHDMAVHFQRCAAFGARGSISEGKLMFEYCTEVYLKFKLRKNKEVTSVTFIQTYQTKTSINSCRRKKRINV
jgi:hypothetical protein